jgi:hypothetical protein
MLGPSDDDEDELLEGPNKTLSWTIESLVSSTLLATQRLEEIEAFFIMATRQSKHIIMRFR